MQLPINYNETGWATRKRARLQYITEQQEKCYHCKYSIHKEPPSTIQNTPITLKLFPVGFLDHPIHLHHDHITGMTIGVTHSICNAILWQYHQE